MKKVIRAITFSAIAATFSLPAFAQTTTTQAPAEPAAAAAQAGTCDEKTKNDLYERWRTNRKTDQKVAFEAGRQLGQICPEDELYVKYVKKFVNDYESATRRSDFYKAVGEKKYNDSFRLGRELLSANQDDLPVLITLGWTGYLASTEKNDAFISDARTSARRALDLIQAGKVPTVYNAQQGKDVENWAPFPTKDDAVGGLNFALGVFALNDKRWNDALQNFVASAQPQNSFTRKEPNTYANIAFAYQAGQYVQQAEDYKTRCTDATAAAGDECKRALEMLNGLSDRIIDAYARAVAYSGNEARYQTQKTDWMSKLKEFYKFRHNDSEDGLNTLIASVLQTPLPTGPITGAPSIQPTASQPATTGSAAVTNSTTTTTTTTTTTQRTSTDGTKPKPGNNAPRR